ncbi:AzlC family ABC transporter permease [Peteryoungia desertarenae]|uniref:AzlC family ABC transporter permease n=1 Tax=Peteryoungia desertarenae TaxID=1813451 RepID=A0ABX6QRJ9_9HYPH|nr:AzlC family ABC transporter permease [Peteryoungia desertarenae]QLF70815.1 AzlC family ABC transporter permease [Peteryoungia desertarenae]
MSRSEFGDGVAKAVPVIISASPFAVLFGAIAVANGLTVFEAGLTSATVFAGASQLVGIELFGNHVPAWLIILSVFAVNFRHVLYSAALTPLIEHFSLGQKAATLFLLTDPQFAESLKRREIGKQVTFSWYMGLGLPIFVAWVAMTLVGAFFGKLIGDPARFGLDVLLPIYFMALVLGFRRRSNFLPVVAVSAVASVIAHKTVGSPWHVSIGAIAGVLAAALMPPPVKRKPDEEAHSLEAGQ